MREANLIDLEHITGTNIRMIANKANCDRSYVWMLLNGKKEARSQKAKAILQTAKSINQAIEVRLNKLELQTQDVD